MKKVGRSDSSPSSGWTILGSIFLVGVVAGIAGYGWHLASAVLLVPAGLFLYNVWQVVTGCNTVPEKGK